MKVTILHSIDGTTKTDVFEGVKVTGQIYPDGRGVVTVYDADGKALREKFYSRVYTIDREIR